MKPIIHGTLRLLLAIGGIYLLCDHFAENYKLSTFLKTASTGGFVAIFVFLQMMSCFVLYMGINGIRDFMRKRIRMRLMYAVNALIILAAILYTVLSKDDGTGKSDPPGNWDFLYLLGFLAIIYFMVYDFIMLFIKRKKIIEQEQQEPEFGIENIR